MTPSFADVLAVVYGIIAVAAAAAWVADRRRLNRVRRTDRWRGDAE